jgi:OOP family OmpA-OmpF porin
MKQRYSYLLILALSIVSSFSVLAQDPNFKPVLPVYRDVVGDSTVIPKSRQDQQKDFMEGNYIFPPKPSNRWEVDLNGGLFIVSGDIATKGGYGFGASVRKAIGYVVSAKVDYMHGQTYGQNWQSNQGIANNPVLNGRSNPATNYFNFNGSKVFMNYKNITNQLNGQIILTVNNIGFHKRALDRKVNLYLGLGGGGMTYRTWYDLLDANGNKYDFTGVADKGLYPDRKTTLKGLKDLVDKNYETLAEGQPDQPELLGGVFKPVVVASIGFGFHLSKRLSLSITDKVTMTNDDLLDGQRWQEHPYIDPVLTRDFDATHYVSLGLGYFIGTKNTVEPMYWQNPMDYTYDALQTLMKKNIDDLIDTDNDGVVDKLDEEKQSAPGAIVNTHGVTTDGDKDGVPDYKDLEPFSVPNAKVDTNGIDLNPCANCKPGSGGGGGGTGIDYCSFTKFPSVHFDLDKYYIKPEFYSHLYQIAMAMKTCPDKKMVAIGNTDVRESNAYNDVLSWERVNKVIDYLVTTYDLDRSRFIVDYKGEVSPKIPGLPDNSWSPVYESRQYQNRRVDFRWANANETGNPNPAKPKGPNKAGEDY